MSGNKKISQLANIPSINGNELIEIVVGGVNYSVTPNQLAAYIMSSSLSGAIATTGTNNYVGTIAGLTSNSQLLNKNITLIIANANTGDCSINFGFGAISWRKFGNVPFEANDVKNNQRVMGNYDGTYLQIMTVTDNIGEGN